MIDYIVWLLETQEEEEETEPLAWQSRRFWGGARARSIEAAREGERPSPAEVAPETLPEGAVPRLWRETDFPSAPWGMEGSAGVDGEKVAWEGEAADAGGAETAIPTANEAGVRRAAALYREAALLGRRAGFAGVERRRETVRQANPAEGVRLPDWQPMDLAFQRDARRYDGGFPLL